MYHFLLKLSILYSKISPMSGKIDVSKLDNTFPEDHELKVARYFADRGKNVTFIRPSNIPGVHTPDIYMDGVEWEIKSPVGTSKRTIEVCLRKAITQSDSIIFDLRRSRLKEEWAVSQLLDNFKSKTKIKRLLIIKKNGELISRSR